MTRKVQNAYYANDEKTQIECEFVQPDGSLQRGVINKASGDGNDLDNPDWAWVHKELGQKEIDAKTGEYLDHIANQEAEAAMKKEREEGEKLFNMKLKIFEIEEIRDSKNSKMKAKIRRSDDPAKLNVYAAALVVMEMAAADAETPPVKKKPPVKRKPVAKNPAPPKMDAPPKKKAAKKAPVKKVRLVDNIHLNAVEPIEAVEAKKDIAKAKGVIDVKITKGMSNNPPPKPKRK